MAQTPPDAERDRLPARVNRYAKVGGNMGGLAVKMMGRRILGFARDDARAARELTAALGGLKGPLMKVAQLLATIPDLLPPEYAHELATLQAQAPAMGWPFVRRRMRKELGENWQDHFASFDTRPSAAASLGQVHQAESHDGEKLACKLQYPDMTSAVEADLRQLKILFSLHRRMRPAIDTQQIFAEISARVREELDYHREARHIALYQDMFRGDHRIQVPQVKAALSTERLLTMGWLEGRPLPDFVNHPSAARNNGARIMFCAWWRPFSRYGIIHGDPHLGNYTLIGDKNDIHSINLLDYGCVRIFPPRFVAGVVDLYHGLLHDNRDLIVSAYESWGFQELSNDLIDILNIWAKFIYGPLLTDRVRTVADGVKPSEYGRREAFQVHKALQEKGPVTVPREFVFMDRAAVGLGAVFLHLKAEINFYRMFNEEIEGFTQARLAQKQADALSRAGIDPAAEPLTEG